MLYDDYLGILCLEPLHLDLLHLEPLHLNFM